MAKKILIIGAGPAGCTAAYKLSASKDFDCHLIELSKEVGGMSRSISVFDQTVDIGPHRFFSNDNRVNQIWLEVVSTNYRMVDRVTRIYYKGKYYDYPLKPINALRNLGLIETIRCICSFFYTKLFPVPENDTFENWVINRFGDRLYKTFFKNYTEKLWGIPCTELTAEFAKQRIKKFSLWEAILNAFSLDKTRHKTLVDQFAYPLYGNGYTYQKMIESFISNGGAFSTSTFITEVCLNSNDTISVLFNSGKTEIYDHLISTMPIDNFIKIIKDVPAQIKELTGFLKFRNTIILYVKLDQENLFIDQWLYIQDDEIECGRITNFNNWIPEITNGIRGTVLALEYWCYNDDPLWKLSDEALLKIAEKDLITAKFIKKAADIKDFKSMKVPKCYPVYDKNYKEPLDKIKTYLSAFSNLHLIGRYGSFKYNNQDHSILMGNLAARNLLFNEKHDLWEINSDYEYHESSRITQTGLVHN